jgi:amino acid transporter
MLLVLTRGAGVGVRALYVVVSTLLASLFLFFLGSPVEGFDPGTVGLTQTIMDADPFIVVFAIVFPAFTGMTAGVGLSGDLADPKKSITRGTIAATLTGMVVYVFVIFKLAFSAPAELLGSDQLVMSQIAVWGPMILIGLGAATLSSAIGSVLVAPRTLQALGADNTFPVQGLNTRLAAGFGAANEPRFATMVTGALALIIVLLGNVNAVARLISMFFMVTYGALCAISFLEHFAARPSFRPSFRSRWYISLFGAVMCLLMMFQMDPLFAVLALMVMVAIYWLLTHSRPGEDDLVAMFQGVMTQLTRYLNIRLQEARSSRSAGEWRPSVLMVNDRTFDRRSPMVLLRWLCHRHGFGTYLHYIQGNLNARTYRKSEKVRQKLIELAKLQKSTVYLDTIVSPSMTSALAQSLQIPGVSGLSNNAILFEFSTQDPPEVLQDVIKNAQFSENAGVDLFVLRHGEWHFGERRNIHVWLTWNDQSNANLMILLSYILLGHPEWAEAEISIFAALPREQLAEQRAALRALMKEGRLPVSEKNLRFHATQDQAAFHRLVSRISTDADLTVVGFDHSGLVDRPVEVFTNHPTLKDVLFIHTSEHIEME